MYEMDCVEDEDVMDTVTSISTSRVNMGIECTTLDLRNYLSRYDGHTKLKRLQFIIEQSVNLRTEAYFLLMEEYKKGVNTEAYEQYAKLSLKIIGVPWEMDQNWIDNTQKKMAARLERLTNESSAARSSMINESIRLSYSDLGYHYYEIGNLNEALRLFMRMRDYCTTNRHHADMTFSIINVMTDLGSFTSIPSYLTKSSNWSNDPILNAKSKVVMGIHELVNKNYTDSARHFLTVEKELESNFCTVISPEDIALYGVLLGLASFSRLELKRYVESRSFKSYLEITPDVQLLIGKFLNRAYGECLPYLFQMKPQWKLDIYLSNHIDSIISKIEERLIIEYFVPYSAISLTKMSMALNMSIDQLESQLYKLIITKKIEARIDDESRTLILKSDSSRTVALNHVKKLTDSHLQQLKVGLLRLNIIKNGLTLNNADGNERDGVGKIDALTKASITSAVNFDTRRAVALTAGTGVVAGVGASNNGDDDNGGGGSSSNGSNSNLMNMNIYESESRVMMHEDEDLDDVEDRD